MLRIQLDVRWRESTLATNADRYIRQEERLDLPSVKVRGAYLQLQEYRAEVCELTRNSSASFREISRRSISQAMKPQLLMFYGAVAIIFTAFSFVVSYQTQVYMSIAAGIAVALLLPTSMVLSRGFASSDTIFMGGILFLLMALFKSDLPMRAVLENIRHLSLILSVVLTGLYVVLRVSRRGNVKSHTVSVKSLGDFFMVCSTTLSSELCSCLHPVLFLETLGILAFLPNQVRLGFVIMMTTLVRQVLLTYESYESRRRD